MSVVPEVPQALVSAMLQALTLCPQHFSLGVFLLRNPKGKIKIICWFYHQWRKLEHDSQQPQKEREHNIKEIYLWTSLRTNAHLLNQEHPRHNRTLKTHRIYYCIFSDREFYSFLTEMISIFAHFSQMENFHDSRNPLPVIFFLQYLTSGYQE